jgi:hypothetical protein
MSVLPRLFGYGPGDHAQPNRYPLSTCTPNIKECEPGLARRLALETRVLDERAIGGQIVRPFAATRVPNKKKPGKWPGKIFSSAAEALQFCVVVLVPPTCPRSDGGPQLGRKSRRGERLHLGAWLTACDGRIDERPHEKEFFARLPPLFSGKTEVTGELD